MTTKRAGQVGHSSRICPNKMCLQSRGHTGPHGYGQVTAELAALRKVAAAAQDRTGDWLAALDYALAEWEKVKP